IRTDGKGGEWNKFLYQSGLSALYFIFLERLVLTHPNVDYYSFWPPPATEGENALIQSAVWERVCSSSRRLFIDSTRGPVPISQTIFDRNSKQRIASLVKRILPGHVVVSNPTVLRGMFDKQRGPVSCLDPTYVRTLLRHNNSVVRMKTLSFNDQELKSLLQFL